MTWYLAIGKFAATAVARHSRRDPRRASFAGHQVVLSELRERPKALFPYQHALRWRMRWISPMCGHGSLPQRSRQPPPRPDHKRLARGRMRQPACAIPALSTNPNAAEMSFAAIAVSSAARSAETRCEPSRYARNGTTITAVT